MSGNVPPKGGAVINNDLRDRNKSRDVSFWTQDEARIHKVALELSVLTACSSFTVLVIMLADPEKKLDPCSEKQQALGAMFAPSVMHFNWVRVGTPTYITGSHISE